MNIAETRTVLKKVKNDSDLFKVVMEYAKGLGIPVSSDLTFERFLSEREQDRLTGFIDGLMTGK